MAVKFTDGESTPAPNVGAESLLDFVCWLLASLLASSSSSSSRSFRSHEIPWQARGLLLGRYDLLSGNLSSSKADQKRGVIELDVGTSACLAYVCASS